MYQVRFGGSLNLRHARKLGEQAQERWHATTAEAALRVLRRKYPHTPDPLALLRAGRVMGSQSAAFRWVEQAAAPTPTGYDGDPLAEHNPDDYTEGPDIDA